VSPLRAALVAVGDELLAGEKVNGNGALLGEQLAATGIPVRAQLVVGDDIDDIAAAVRYAAALAPVVIVCGGLGPTQDDLTREGLALAVGVPLERDPALEQALRERFAALGRTDVPAMNWRQADLPRGATPMANPAGSAPGLLLPFGDRVIYALPGVPRELTALWHAAVAPDLRRRYPSRPVVLRSTLRTVGLWESAVAAALEPEVRRTAGSPQVAFLASGGETRVVVTATGADLAAAQALAAPTLAFARQALGEAVYDGPSLQAEVIALLIAAGATVACAESLTAGMVAARLADVAGASAALRGGVVAYATDLKARLLQVPAAVLAAHGPVSEPTARAMAIGVAASCSATYGLALTGVAGPQHQDGHPPGTVHLAVAGPAGVLTRALTVPGDRAAVRGLATTAALALLRTALRRAGATAT
jgi:nicotinamide-nucleotide amidase